MTSIGPPYVCQAPKRVARLLLVPISENEYQFAQIEGVAKLEDIFEERQIDIFKEAEEEYGGTWTTRVVTYDRP